MAEFIMVGLLAVLYIGMGMPLAGRKIGRNRSYGFSRVSKYMLTNDEIWFSVNEMGGRHMVNTGLILIAIAVLLLISSGKILMVKLLLLAALLISMAGIIYSSVKCKALANKMIAEKGLEK